MKPVFILSGVLLMAAIACNSVATSQLACEPCAPAATTQTSNLPAQVLLEAEGKSSPQLNTEIEPYLKQAGWESWGLSGDDLTIFAAPGLDLREPTLSYHLHFDTSKSRYLATVITQLYFVPEKSARRSIKLCCSIP